MDEQSIFSSKKYFSFKNELEKKIKDTKISLDNDICYLIKVSWIDEFAKVFNNYFSESRPSREYGNIYISEAYLKKNIEFVNDISSAINCLKEKEDFQLLNKKLLESFYGNNYELRKNNYVNFYAGNNKIIIEFIKRFEQYSLLLVNPLSYEKEIYFIDIKKFFFKNQLYREILSYNENISNFVSKKPYYKNAIKSFSDFTNNNIQYDKDELIKIKILKIFIFIFYYEKILSTNNINNIFNTKEEYYLIDSEWIKKFKAHYSYDKIKDLLNIEYNNSNNKYPNRYIIKDAAFLIKDIKINTFQLYEDFDYDKINPYLNIKNIKKLSSFYIIRSKLFNLIKIFLFKSDEKRKNENYKKLLFNNGDIFLIDNNNSNIIIGNFNRPLFIPKYFLSYKNFNIFDWQKFKIIGMSSVGYLKSLNFEEDNYNIQPMYEKKDLIGEIIILNNYSIERKIKETSKEKALTNKLYTKRIINSRKRNELSANKNLLRENSYRTMFKKKSFIDNPKISNKDKILSLNK